MNVKLKCFVWWYTYICLYLLWIITKVEVWTHLGSSQFRENTAGNKEHFKKKSLKNYKILHKTAVLPRNWLDPTFVGFRNGFIEKNFFHDTTFILGFEESWWLPKFSRCQHNNKIQTRVYVKVWTVLDFKNN